jgi:dynein heavy chain
LDDWEREKRAFMRLKEIEFFKNYKKWKSYNVWKRLTKRNIMKECAKIIGSKLYQLDRTLRKPLLEIRSFCYLLEGISLFEHRFLSPVSADELAKIGEEFRSKVVEKKMLSLDTSIKNVLV